jgi:hypothetical protein
MVPKMSSCLVEILYPPTLEAGPRGTARPPGSARIATSATQPIRQRQKHRHACEQAGGPAQRRWVKSRAPIDPVTPPTISLWV